MLVDRAIALSLCWVAVVVFLASFLSVRGTYRDGRRAAAASGIGPLGAGLPVAAMLGLSLTVFFFGRPRGPFGYGLAAAAAMFGTATTVEFSGAAAQVLALRAPRRAVGEVTAGRVLVTGSVVPADGTVETPCAGVDAVCCRSVVSAYREPGLATLVGAGNRYVLDFEEQRRTFYLEDGGDRVLVDPAGATLRPSDPGAVDRGRPAPDVTTRLPEDDYRGDRPVCEEQVVAPGDQVTVAGVAGTDDGNEQVTVTAAGVRPGLVAVGPPEVLARELRRKLLWTGGLGVGSFLLGAAGMLWTSGLVPA